MKDKKIMGLDISSATIGYCILDYEKVITYDYLKNNEKYNEYQQIQIASNTLIDIANEHEVDEIAIEQISEFFGNKSTSKTIIKLAKWNSIISYAMFNNFFNINHHNVNSIRKLLKDDFNNKNKSKLSKIKKEEVPDIISDLLDFKFEYEYNKNGKLKMENYDKADAIAVAYYHLFNNLKK